MISKSEKRKIHKIHFSVSKKTIQQLLKYTHEKWSLNPDKFLSVAPSFPEARKRVIFLLNLVCDFPHELNIHFCDLTEMQEMNQRFRGKNYPTDVLSFPRDHNITTAPGDSGHSLGDILICLPVCAYQATKAKQTLSQELDRMLIHAICHLKGFDHERGQDAWNVQKKLEEALKKSLDRSLKKPTWCPTRIITKKRGV